MNLSELKTLLISAKNEFNNMLCLNRSKKIKYEDRQYFDLIAFSSLWNAAGEDSSKIMNVIDDVPSGDALMQQLQKLDLELVEEQFDKVFEHQFKKVFKKKKKPNTIAIIDVHEQETYSKEKRTSEDIRGGKHKNGTNFFFHFATIQILAKNKILTLKVKLYRRQQSLKKIVEELVRQTQKYVKIKVLLLDRGFRNVKIVNELEYLQVPILMPCVKDEKTRKELAKLDKNKKIIKWWFKNTKGEFADVKLVMIKFSDDKEIGFYTTIPFARLKTAKYFLNLYKKRWNIETGYRLQNQLLARTTCIKGIVRYFYFCYAVAMHNLWLCIKCEIGKTILFTVNKMKFILVYFWITTHLNPEL